MTPTSEQIEVSGKALDKILSRVTARDIKSSDKLAELYTVVPQLLADQQSNNGWCFDMENAPDDRKVDLLFPTSTTWHRQTNCWLGADKKTWLYNHDEQGPLPVETHSIKAIAYHLIELPEGGSRQCEYYHMKLKTPCALASEGK